MGKKLLLLGGLRYLIPVIKAAKSMGHYVITCDYLPDNIAHTYADEYHNVSITDKEAVLALAEQLQIDGIMSFAVDPGVITAAYVNEKLGLPSAGPFKSIEILQNKALFRKFLAENNFNVPLAKSYHEDNVAQAVNDFSKEKYPVIVKPVDSAGSKGVAKVNSPAELEGAIEYALRFSTSKAFIIEEFLESKGYSSDSDSFSVDGELRMVTFSAQRFDVNSPNPYTPSAYSWPASIDSQNQSFLKGELQRLITLLGMKSSVYNIEVRETLDGVPYIMEVSPRGGGNRLSEMVRFATGVDFISAAINASLGDEILISPKPFEKFWAEIILYSNVAGRFKEIQIAEEIKYAIKEVDLWVGADDFVNGFNAANDAIGTAVLQFNTQEELDKVISDYSRFIKIVVD